MKKLYLWWQNTRKYILLDIFLLFTITVALYSLSNAFASYRMLTLEQELLNTALENEKSGYFKPIATIRYTGKDEYAVLNYNKKWHEDIKALRNTESVEAVHTNYSFGTYFYENPGSDKQSALNMHIFHEKSTNLFPNLYEGEWPKTPFDSDGNLNAVVYGSFADDLEIGSIFSVSAKTGEPLELRICGKLYNSYPYPSYSGGGSEANAEMIYGNDSAYHAFIYECDETMEYMWASDSAKLLTCGESFIIEFTEDASDEELEAVLDDLAKKGGVSYIKDISAKSKEMSDEMFKSRMTVPIFYTVISFCAFVCITILYIIKRTKEYAVYHLLGYSKKQMTASIVLRIVSIISLSALINVLYIENYYTLLAKGIVTTDLRPPYFDGSSVVLIIIICAIMLIFSLVAALCTLNSRAPIDLQRIAKE